MTRESTAPKPTQQAHLKLEGQKLLKMDDSGGLLSTLGGLPLAARLAQETGLIEMAIERIEEWRNPDLVDFEISELLSQRLFLVADGQPDAIDCSLRKNDPALKAAVGKEPDGPPLSSQSTHTRMEQRMTESSMKGLEALPLDFFFSRHERAPRTLTVYIDGLAIRTFGAQQRSTHRGGKKYSQMQYFPLLATTSSGWLLLAQLRAGSASDAKAVPSVQKLALDIKAQWKATRLNIVMDTGFNSPELLDFFEEEKIEYECGYPATSSVLSKVPDVLEEVEAEFVEEHGEPRYTGPKSDEKWQAEHDRIRALPAEERMEAEKAMSARRVRRIVEIMHNGVGWDCDRRLIVRVDYGDRGLDVRCVVTNKERGLPESIYEEDYCKRARVEMFIKENKSHCKVPLSCQEFISNQFRFFIQGLSYQLLHLMRLELPPTQQNISIAGVRRMLLQVPVLIVPTARRLHWRLSSVHPYTKAVIRMAQKLNNRAA